MQCFCIHSPSYNSSCITLSRFPISSIIVIKDRWICVHLSMYTYMYYICIHNIHVTYWIHLFFSHVHVLMPNYLWLGNLCGRSSLEKSICLFLSRHWISIALKLGVELCGISAFHIGMSACFFIILLSTRQPYYFEIKGQFPDIFRRHYLTADLLLFWLLGSFCLLFYVFPRVLAMSIINIWRCRRS